VEKNKNENQVQEKNQVPATFIDARVALSKDRQYILHFLTDGTILRIHSHLYKHLLKVPYQRKNGDQVSFA